MNVGSPPEVRPGALLRARDNCIVWSTCRHSFGDRPVAHGTMFVVGRIEEHELVLVLTSAHVKTSWSSEGDYELFVMSAHGVIGWTRWTSFDNTDHE